MFPATMRFRGGRSLLCLAGGAIVIAPIPCAIAGIALILVRQVAGFARGIQAALVVAPVAVAVLEGPGPVLAAMVVLLLAVGIRAALADRALRRAGIDKDALG
jgi:rhodanese-related sulfurtransferase